MFARHLSSVLNFSKALTFSHHPLEGHSSRMASNPSCGGRASLRVWAGVATVRPLRLGAAGACALLLLGGSIPVHAQSVSFAGAQTTVGSGLSYPIGVAVDGAGNVFIADAGNNLVVEIPASGGTQTTVAASGLNDPASVAVDGAGDVFIADARNNRVVEVPAGGGAQTTVGTGLSFPTGVAVDGAGDVFIADSRNNRVVEVPAGGGAQTTVGTGLSEPYGVAVDGAGDVFIADTYNNRVVEVPAGGGAQTTVASGLSFPYAVAVDGAGDVFIAEEGNNLVVEVPAGGGAQTTVGSGLSAPTGVAVDGAGDVFITDSGNYRVVEVQRVAVNFGNVNICPGGQTTPAPCSQTLTLNYSVNDTTTFGSNPTVLTKGAPNLDFTLSSTTCTGPGTPGETCTVNVSFAPRAPGLRMGAVQLTDSSGNLLVTTFLHGEGQGPAIAFGPSAQTTVAASGLNDPASVAVDGAGDVFIADARNNRVVEVPAGGGAQTTVGTGLSFPTGVAVDGAGDVFIADSRNNRVVEVPAGGGAQTTVGTGLSEPYGVAVDGAGDVFIADTYNNRVVEVPAGGGAQTTVASGLSFPYAVAVDGAGDVFIAEEGNNLVVEVPAGGGAQTTVGSGLSAPTGVAVDGAGDVFITDSGNYRVVEVPAGGGAQTTVGSGLSYPIGAAVDGAGDVFIADAGNNLVVEVQRSQPPTFSFAATAVGNTSTDSPQSVTVQNIGNQSLAAVSPGLSIGSPSFVQDFGLSALADCTSSFSLAPGASCNLSVSFIPQTTGSIVNAVTFTDNALNATPSASQSITLNGTGQPGTVNVTVGTSPAGLSFAVDGTTYTSAQILTWTIGSSHTIATTSPQAPVAGTQYTFVSWSDGTTSLSDAVTASASTTSYAASFTTSYQLTTAANPANGGTVSPTSGGYYPSGTVVNLLATAYSGYTFTSWTGNVASTSSASTTVTMNAPQSVTANFQTSTVKDTPTINWGTPAAITYGTALTSKQLDATATYNGSSVGGTFVYTPAKGAVLGAGSQTLSVTFTPTNTTKYTTATGSVTLVVNQDILIVKWAKPATIIYETPLSSTQLDARAVDAGGIAPPGTFAYSPAAGTVLDAGNYTLTVTFTPTDTTDYTTATDTVTLTVNKASSTVAITSHTPNPSLVDQAVTVSFEVTGGGVGPTGSVTVTAGTGETCSAVLSAGTGSCSLTFTTARSRMLTAKYAGDSNFKSSSSAAVTQTVQK